MIFVRVNRQFAGGQTNIRDVLVSALRGYFVFDLQKLNTFGSILRVDAYKKKYARNKSSFDNPVCVCYLY